MTQTFRNVGSVSTPFNSDPASPETQSEDFKGLLDLWKGDWPSEDTTGVEVTERILWVEGDMVCGRMRSVQPRLPEQFQLSTDSTSIEFGPIDSLTQLVETNGKTEPNVGGTLVRWPPDAREIRLKVRGTEPVHPFSQAHREEIIRMGGTKPKE